MAKRIAALFLCMALLVLCLLPAAAPAENEAKVIRVGWYDTPFNQKDSFGRRTGYAYEYQRKIAAYTGWKYEYVEGNWPELLQMLRDGQIDLMSDVSYTEERAEEMLFSNMPMGSELYFLFISPENRTISIDNPSTLNRKKVGVTRGSIQKNLFENWAEEQNLFTDLVELDCSEAESLKMLQKGELDAFVTLDTYSDPKTAVPLWKIGSSDFYFAVSLKRPDLLDELNTALSRIQDENKHYTEQLSAKYLMDSGTNRYLTVEERDWLKNHGKIRVAYQDNYMAFCAADPKTGELTGALKDYLEYAKSVLANTEIEFETMVYPTANDAIEAVKNGDADCMFPANLTDYDGEMAGVIMTAPIMRTEMDAVVRAEDRQNFLRKTQVRVGVNRGNPNYEMFLTEHFPNWTAVYFANTPECLDAVAAKNADCVILSNYRFTDIARQCRRLNLETVYTGVDLDYCLAVHEGNTTLYSILSKVIGEVPDSVVNAALTYWSASAQENDGLIDYMLQHPALLALAAACAALAVACAALAWRVHRLRRNTSKPNVQRST